MMTLAKALGNGMPIGACLVARRASGALGPGTHGSTFGGNPLACAAARAVIQVVERDGLCERATEAGARLADGLRKALEGVNCVKGVRNKGMMVAVVLDRPCPELVQKAMDDEGFLINVTADSVVRLLPPLVISDAEIDQLAAGLGRVIRDWNAGSKT